MLLEVLPKQKVLSLVLRETCFCIFPCRSINLVYQSKVIPETKGMFIDHERDMRFYIFPCRSINLLMLCNIKSQI
ncbi:hypothetical protein P8452_11604 [Trifolium repens]|nr:hypothetical protein P8452_11604 [Trifolium repens]